MSVLSATFYPLMLLGQHVWPEIRERHARTQDPERPQLSGALQFGGLTFALRGEPPTRISQRVPGVFRANPCRRTWLKTAHVLGQPSSPSRRREVAKSDFNSFLNTSAAEVLLNPRPEPVWFRSESLCAIVRHHWAQ